MELYDLLLAKSLGGGGGGGGSSEADREKDVRFFDYDGKCLYSYSAEEFQNLSEMPENPTRRGLVAQGWNWTLAEAKAYVSLFGIAEIGQMYATESGATEVIVQIDEAARKPYVSLGVNGTVTIDWGDGTATETLTGTSLTTRKDSLQHTYADAGEYTVKITPGSGTAYQIMGMSNHSCLFWGKVTSTVVDNIAYVSCIKEIHVGANASLGSGAFGNCYGLEKITIPEGTAFVNGSEFYQDQSLRHATVPRASHSSLSNTFYYCQAMRSLSLPGNLTAQVSYLCYYCTALVRATIPTGVTKTTPSGSCFNNCRALKKAALANTITALGASDFAECWSLEKVNFPTGATTIMNYMFNNCKSLKSFTVPENVTAINGNAFYSVKGMREIHMLPTTPPTLANKYCIYDYASDLVIYVPQGSLADYQAAAYWSDYTNLQEEP